MKNRIIYGMMLCFAAEMQGQSQLTNNGNLALFAGASMSLFGDFINNGTVADSGKVITLSGSSAQGIGGSSVTTFNNLTLNNAAGSSLSADVKLRGVLTISSGIFTATGRQFTLLSDATGTARIAPILGDFAGNITMQRYISTGVADWRFLASPVSGATIADWQDNFITTGFPGSTYPGFSFVSVYTYDETVPGTDAYGYNAPAGATDPLTPGKGYWCYLGAGNFTADVTGPPVKFNFNFPVSYTPNAGAAYDGWMMTGNPYPSPIDWSSSSWTKQNINSAIYIWNPALQQYASWISGISTNGGSNIIASSQSFWVQSNAANPVLTCNENVKASSDQPFLRPENQAFDYLKLRLAGNGYTDEAYIRFGAGATKGFDADLDARKMFSSNAAVPSLSSQDSSYTDLSVNSLPVVDNTISIPVKTLAGTSGTYSLSFDSSSSLPPGMCIVLEDLLTGQRSNLVSTPVYTFNIADTTTAARFLIHITSGENYTAQVPASCYGFHNGMAIARGAGTGPWDYTWRNASGTSIKVKTNAPGADTLLHVAAGIYYTEVSGPGSMCAMVASTVVVSEPAPIVAAFTLSSDSIFAGQTDSIHISNLSSQAMHYRWYFGDGSPVDTMPSPHAHSYTTAGHYTISLVASADACKDSVTEAVIVRNPVLLGIANVPADEGILVYPNPGHGLFYVQVPAHGNITATMDLYEAAGERVCHREDLRGKTEINLEQLAQGIYFYKIFLPGQPAYTGKLVIE